MNEYNSKQSSLFYFLALVKLAVLMACLRSCRALCLAVSLASPVGSSANFHNQSSAYKQRASVFVRFRFHAEERQTWILFIWECADFWRAFQKVETF